MTVSMRKASTLEALGEKCYICWEDFNDNSRDVLGHPKLQSADNKIYCFVHSSCLKKTIGMTESTRCPHCRERIKAASVFSWRDLERNAFNNLAKNIMVDTALVGVTTLLGSLLINRAMSRGPLRNLHLLHIIAIGALVSGGIGLFRSRSNVKVNLLMGAACGFFGATSATLHPHSSRASLGTAALAVSMCFMGSTLGAKMGIDQAIAKLDQT